MTIDAAVQTVPVRNKEREAAFRRDINELLLRHLNGEPTIAELEMIGDRIFGIFESWNRKGVPLPPE